MVYINCTVMDLGKFIFSTALNLFTLRISELQEQESFRIDNLPDRILA